MNSYIVKDLLHYCNVSFNKTYKLNSKTIDFYDLTFVLEGKSVYWANGKRYVVEKNDAVFLTPGTCRMREETNIPVHYVSFNFTVNSCAEINFNQYIKSCINGTIRKLISSFPQSHLLPGMYSAEKCTNMLNFILFELISGTTRPAYSLCVLKMLDYINSHIYDKISLDAVSSYAHITKEYACMLFKREVGSTIINYVNQAKLSVAKNLILDNDMSLLSISERLSYSDYNYFARIFKKHFGISPGQFKKICYNKKAESY